MNPESSVRECPLRKIGKGSIVNVREGMDI